MARSLGALSLNERLVCEPLARSTIYEAFQPRQGIILDVAFVQTERKFVNIAVQMLRADVVIDTDQAALQYTQKRFRCYSWSLRRGHISGFKHDAVNHSAGDAWLP